MSYLEQIDKARLPKHIAIIMDGNGRWAKAQGKERTFGHAEGAQRVHEIMEAATRLGIEYLTIYAFSTENWNRPEAEVTALMALLLQHIEEEVFVKNNARFKVIGNREPLPQPVKDAIAHLELVTEQNSRCCMVMALSYSSKWEVTKAIKDISADVKAGRLNEADINEGTLDKYLATNFMMDPDMIIRTGGEQRLSNFLLWQAAYSEFYFTDVFWPEFTSEEFYKSIVDYQSRQRRFGKTGEQVESKS